MVLLSQYLGHAQVETTMIYAHAVTEMKRAAIQKADAIRKAKPESEEAYYVIPKFLQVTPCTIVFSAITSK